MGIGVDIVKVDRFHLDHIHFIKRVLTPKEYEIFLSYSLPQRRLEYLAGRFAGKEAYMKACHKGIGHLSFLDIEILNDEFGAPYLNDIEAEISISHEKDYAIAFVVKK